MSNNKNETAGETAMKEVVTYTFNPTNQPIRVEIRDNAPWFVAKDVCDALQIINITDTMNRLDDDEKLTSVVSNSGQGRQMWLINESGLYNLIFQSRKPEAKAFRKWVTSEVLPSIRRTGRYEMSSPAPKALRSPRVKPRDRSAEMGEFFLELRRWVRRSDVDETAELCGVRRKSVMDVLGGLKPGADVLELLVAYAKDNRSRGRMTDIQRSRREDYARRAEQLRLEFMKEGGAR